MKCLVSDITGFFPHGYSSEGRSVYHKDLHRSKNAEKGTHYIPDDPGEGTVPAPIMTPVVLLFLKTRWQVICDTYIWLTKSWWRPHNFLSDDVYLTTRKPRFNNFLVSSKHLSRKTWHEPQALEYSINWEIYTPYADGAGMLLHLNWKCSIENVILLSLFCRKCPSATGPREGYKLVVFIWIMMSTWFSKHECSLGLGSEHIFERQWCIPNGCCINSGEISWRI